MAPEWRQGGQLLENNFVTSADVREQFLTFLLSDKELAETF